MDLFFVDLYYIILSHDGMNSFDEVGKNNTKDSSKYSNREFLFLERQFLKKTLCAQKVRGRNEDMK